MTRIYKCDYCGKEDTAAADEYRLQKCTGCNKNLYCSRECQKLDWPSHKNRCRRKANDAAMLVLQDEKVPNLDRLMSYASRYMHNLKHVQFELNGYDTTMSTNVLLSFLQSSKGNLESLVWGRYPLADFTDGGKVWTELHGLKYIELVPPIFNNYKDLVKVINQQQETIECLSLINIRLGDSRGTRYDWSNIASSISKCRHLIRLNMNQHLLRDSDMEGLLSSLPNLKTLLLCGPKNQRGQSNSKGGHLTDKSCKIIARTCKELREINLACQEKITLSGIKRILKNCQNLRNIRMSLVVSQTDAISMHNLAPSLIFMTMRYDFGEDCYGELIEATEGRVVFSHYDTYTFDYSGQKLSEEALHRLSDETYERYADRQAFIQVYDRGVDDPKVTDEWAFLDTFNNQK